MGTGRGGDGNQERRDWEQGEKGVGTVAFKPCFLFPISVHPGVFYN